MKNKNKFKILMIISAWPTRKQPHIDPFIIRQIKFLRKAGIIIDVFAFMAAAASFFSNFKFLNYFKAWLNIRKKIRMNNYDLIHAQYGQKGLIALPKKLPLVVTFRGSDLEGFVGKNGKYTILGKILRFINKLVALNANECILVSRSLIKHLPKHCSYNIIPSGIDLNLFKPSSKKKAREKLKLPQKTKLILFGGRPNVILKRYSLAKKAVSVLKNKYDIQLIVTKNVRPELMPIYMNACDVLLLTSMHEGSPNVVKEALACDLPIVSVNVGDVKERIGHLKKCSICKNDNFITIANELERILKKKGPFVGRKHIKNLDEKIMTNKVISVYNKVLKNNLRTK